MEKPRKKVFVLGAGITGVLISWKLVKAGVDVTLIERESGVGGLSKTIKWDDFYFDIGAHNFYTYDKEILEFYKKHLPDIFFQRERNFRLFLFSKLLPFPFLGLELLFTLNSKQMITIGLSFFKTKIKNLFIKIKETPHLDEWIISRYGIGLYNIYFKPYLENIQRIDPHFLSSSIGIKKIPAFSIRKIMKTLFNKYILRIPQLPGGGLSFYTKKGYGSIPQHFFDEIKNFENFHFHFDEKISKLNIQNNNILEIITDRNIYEVRDANIISTIPIKDLLGSINGKFIKISEQANKLNCTELRLVLVKVRKKEVTGRWLVYFNDPRMPFYRITEETKNNFEMVPDGYSSLIFEIPVVEGDNLKSIPDSELFPLILERFNLVFPLNIEDVAGYKSIYQDQTNPQLIVNYQNIMKEVFDFIFSFSNLYSLGRQGLFTYLNLDHCTRMALDFSDSYLENKGLESNKKIFNNTLS